MQPVVSSIIPNVITTPLINTAVPGSAIVHMPYDNVAPSVSSAQTDPNARGNSTPPPEEEHAPAAPPPSPFPNFLSNPAVSSSVQATFLAQLISQDASPETTGILVQYEKLVAFSNVKYKPSNAMKPAPEPSGVFGKLLQEERAEPPRVEVPPVPPMHEQAEQAAAVAPHPVEPPRRQPKIETQAKDAPTPAPAAANAYAASVQRHVPVSSGETADSI